MKPHSATHMPATRKASSTRSYDSSAMSIPALSARKKALTLRLGMSDSPTQAEIITGTMAAKDQNIASTSVPPALEVMSAEINVITSNKQRGGSSRLP